MSALDPARPFIAFWHRPTGERLTRSIAVSTEFATSEEAIAAITARFESATLYAEVRDFRPCLAAPGTPSIQIAKRLPNKPVTKR